MKQVSTFLFSSFATRWWGVAMLVGLLLPGLETQAQAPAWQMAVCGNNNPAAAGTSFITATATNAIGDVFVTGWFTGQITLGATVLMSVGDDDMFVAKWNVSANAWAWASSGGGTGSDRGYGVAVNGSNVYVTGSFISANNAYFAGVALPGAGGQDMFVAKYIDAGTSIGNGWAASGGGFNPDQGNAIAVSGSNVYVTGLFYSTSNAHFAGATLVGAGNRDIFLAKYIDTGSTFGNGWAISGGGTGADIGIGVAANGTNVYVTGSFFSASNARIAGAALAGAGDRDIFVAKYTDNGTSAVNGWATSGGSPDGEQADGVTVSGNNVYVAGSVGSTAPVNIAGTTLTNAGDLDMFLAKYTDNGNSFVNNWATSGGGTGIDQGNSIVVSGSSIYVTGFFYSNSGARIAGTMLPGAGNYDSFTAKYTDSGNTVSNAWATSAGGPAGDFSIGFVLSGASLYVTGSVIPPATFGSIALSQPANTASYFLARLGTTLATAPASPSLPITLAPNPATGRFILTLPTAPATATLYNPLGQVVLRRTLMAATTEIDAHGLAAGVYVLRVQAAGGTAMRRVVLE